MVVKDMSKVSKNISIELEYLNNIETIAKKKGTSFSEELHNILKARFEKK